MARTEFDAWLALAQYRARNPKPVYIRPSLLTRALRALGLAS